jgi:hypothetical protein
LNNLIYLVLNSPEIRDQAAYSIMSARHCLNVAAAKLNIVVFTNIANHSDLLADEIVALDEIMVTDWVGPGAYIPRAKLAALSYALKRYGASTVLLDTDTFFRQSPHFLFARIAEGRFAMDLEEMEFPIETRERLLAAEVASAKMATLGLSKKVSMWNSGVIGVCPGDLGAIEEALALCDLVFEATRDWYSEQLVLTYCLSQRGKIASCCDVVYHYCHPKLKESFRQRYKRLISDYGADQISNRVAKCLKYRPIWGICDWLKIAGKQLLSNAGVYKRQIRFRLT